MLQKIYRRIISARNRYLKKIVIRGELRNVEKKKALWSKVELTSKKDREICDYWKKISGHEIDTRWHRLYASYLQCPVKIDFFPEILYSTGLENQLNNPKFHSVLSDKCLLTSLFPGDDKYRIPKTIVLNSYGTFVEGNHRVISKTEAVALLRNVGMVIIKPTVDSSSGESVIKAELADGFDSNNGLSIDQIFDKYKQNFIVQECVKQSEYLSRLCDKSLNTFRVITYICKGKVFHAPLSLRMGTGTAFVDNIHAGGIGIGITDNYKFRKYAFSEMGEKFEVHPYSKIVFEGYDISPLKNIVEVAHHLHGYIPMLKMISWDWSLDEHDIPVLIEINIAGQAVWLSQMVNGESFFGENTEYFANMLKK